MYVHPHTLSHTQTALLRVWSIFVFTNVSLYHCGKCQKYERINMMGEKREKSQSQMEKKYGWFWIKTWRDEKRKGGRERGREGGKKRCMLVEWLSLLISLSSYVFIYCIYFSILYLWWSRNDYSHVHRCLFVSLGCITDIDDLLIWQLVCLQIRQSTFQKTYPKWQKSVAEELLLVLVWKCQKNIMVVRNPLFRFL